MVWSIDQDDSGGYQCNQGKFPLLTKIYDELKNFTTECTTTTKTTSAPPTEMMTTRKKFITPIWNKKPRYQNKDPKNPNSKNPSMSGSPNNNHQHHQHHNQHSFNNFFGFGGGSSKSLATQPRPEVQFYFLALMLFKLIN